MMSQCIRSPPTPSRTTTYTSHPFKGDTDMSITNRRRYERATAEIACKCRRSAKTLYAPAQTLDLSPGGASLQITSPRPTEIGDRLALAFNSPDCPIMSAAKMIGARVVRVTPLRDNQQHIAVEFDAPQFQLIELAAPTTRRAAA